MDQTTHATKTTPTYALLVGVDRYDHFPQNQLYGSTPDVNILAWYLVKSLGVNCKNIRALTCPQTAHQTTEEVKRRVDHSFIYEHLLKENLGSAKDKEEVLQGLAWLLGKAKEEGARVIFAFSGHGAWAPGRGPVLCLGSTTTALDDSGVIRLSDIGKLVGEHDARDQLVALIDCCHVAGPDTPEGFRVTALPPSKPTVAELKRHHNDFDVSDRVLLAARPGHSAYQMPLAEGAHGAMTFGLVTSGERWRATNELSHGSYKQVLKRARRVVKGLGVKQTLKMNVPRAGFEEVRKEPFLGIGPGRTSKTPDVGGRTVQLTPNWYTISVVVGGVSTTLFEVIAMSGSDVTINTNAWELSPVEYWYVNTSALSQVTNTSSALSFTSQSVPSNVPLPSTFTAGPPSFISEEFTNWTSSGKSYSMGTGTTSNYFQGTDLNLPGQLWLELVVTHSAITGNYGLEGVQWWLEDSSKPANGTLILPSTSSNWPWVFSSAPTGAYAAPSY